MGKKNHSKSSSKKPEASIKGKLVEQIVEAMHNVSGLSVRRNVKLQTVGGKGRKREIDVLIESNLAGYPVRIAVECKNLARKVGPEQIDAFVGKLKAVGIPTQHGIYVATNGYTQGALDGAVAAGIRPLVLTGLTAERVSESVADAFESIIYLLLSVDSLSVTNDIETCSGLDELFTFYDDSGAVRSTAPDLIWRMWRDGLISQDLGAHEIDIPFDSNWHCIYGGIISFPMAVKATVRVLGLVISTRGRATQHLLINAIDERVEKAQIFAAFVPDIGGLTVSTFQSEKELEAALNHKGAITVTIGRLPLPRILFSKIYWPPSERAVRALEKAVRANINGTGPDPRTLTLTDVEGVSLNRVWDPVWEGHQSHEGKGKLGG